MLFARWYRLDLLEQSSIHWTDQMIPFYVSVVFIWVDQIDPRSIKSMDIHQALTVCPFVMSVMSRTPFPKIETLTQTPCRKIETQQNDACLIVYSDSNSSCEGMVHDDAVHDLLSWIHLTEYAYVMDRICYMLRNISIP